MSSLILYFKPFLIALIASLVLTKVIVEFGKKFAKGNNIDGKNAKLNFSNGRKNILRFGGVAIIASFIISIFLGGKLEFDSLKWGIVFSSLFILLFGIYDDLKNISWKKQLFGQLIVVIIMLYAGLTVDYIANPLGGAEFRLDQFEFTIFNSQFSILGSLFILFWIVGFMNVMNWLDGLDGLAGGVSLIGAVALFVISTSPLVDQPPLGIMTIIIAGSILGFLVYNKHPAKIFMGTSGSMFLGFILAVLAIFSGGKIATALLVMGFPILDAVWVVARRIKAGDSPFRGDARHLHYQLLKRGWPQKKIVLFVYFICFIFGAMAISFQSMGKALALFAIFLFMVAIVSYQSLRK